MDTLSDVVASLRSHHSYFAGLKAGGDWALDFPPPGGIKFNAVVEGECWHGTSGISDAAGVCIWRCRR
uniref:cupin domain-containing protein n=1 Tax=Pseudomonas sp. EA_65y_Pfl1_P120 TaxID=3088693 RepID=UPI0030DCE909